MPLYASLERRLFWGRLDVAVHILTPFWRLTFENLEWLKFDQIVQMFAENDDFSVPEANSVPAGSTPFRSVPIPKMCQVANCLANAPYQALIRHLDRIL